MEIKIVQNYEDEICNHHEVHSEETTVEYEYEASDFEQHNVMHSLV